MATLSSLLVLALLTLAVIYMYQRTLQRGH